MMPLEEVRLLARVALLYYRQGLKQSDIAERLDLSQATVSRMLRRAVDEGVVRISVSTPPNVFTEIENELSTRYELKTAIVVDCESDDDDDLIQQRLGRAAAYYIETTLGDDEVIGLSSWSATLLAMVDAMHPRNRPTGSTVVQILGGLGNPSASIYASRLTERFAYLVKGQAVYLPAPGVTTSKEAHDSFLHDTFVRHAVEYFDKLTLALVGIGSLEPSVLLSRSGNVFSIAELETLRAANAVGDVCLRFFDGEGRHIQSELDARVFGIAPHQLNNVRRSVGIAGGRRKFAAIRAAIVGRWINIVITDRCTAECLLA
jgi:DNA-binding transcriptional regulator LsrR (DeoR family)